MTRHPNEALLLRLLSISQDAPGAPGSHAKPRKGRKASDDTPKRLKAAQRADDTKRHCLECGAIVGKGRKALTCAVCDLLAVLPRDIPPPQRETRFHPTRLWRFDLAWPAVRLACEVDGGQFMAGGGRHNTDADREKINHAAALGWRVLRFSPQQIAADPDGCVALLRRALEVQL
jgi:hypothetical protein